jgi:hypothetical protein
LHGSLPRQFRFPRRCDDQVKIVMPAPNQRVRRQAIPADTPTGRASRSCPEAPPAGHSRPLHEIDLPPTRS